MKRRTLPGWMGSQSIVDESMQLSQAWTNSPPPSPPHSDDLSKDTTSTNPQPQPQQQQQNSPPQTKKQEPPKLTVVDQLLTLVKENKDNIEKSVELTGYCNEALEQLTQLLLKQHRQHLQMNSGVVTGTDIVTNSSSPATSSSRPSLANFSPGSTARNRKQKLTPQKRALDYSDEEAEDSDGNTQKRKRTKPEKPATTPSPSSSRAPKTPRSSTRIAPSKTKPCLYCGDAGVQQFDQYTFSEIPSNWINSVERQILSNYMSSVDLSFDDVFAQLLRDIDAKKFDLEVNLQSFPSSSTLCCEDCALQALNIALIHFRCSIPEDELPVRAQKRAKCWYGYECKTMLKNDDHANKLDHAGFNTKKLGSPGNKSSTPRKR